MPHQNPANRFLARWILSAAVCGVLAGPLFADPADDSSSPAGVSVPESPGAKEVLDKARDKENQKQWKTAAEFYQDALAKYAGRVVPVVEKRDADKGIFPYSGIAPVVQEREAKWPADGLTIYRNLYGPTANDLLVNIQNGDTAGLRNIFWNYFVTDAGKAAGIRLMDDSMETGDFIAAAWIGNRLLSLHPFLGSDKGMLIYRTAIASQWSGNTTGAKALLDRLKNENAKDVGTIGGKDVVLVDALTSALAVAPLQPTTRPSDADTYPSYGGLGGRGDISPSSAKPGASLNSVLLTPPDTAAMIGQAKSMFQNNDDLSLRNNLCMGIMPVVDGGNLFFQDGRSIYAVDADSGYPLPGWVSTYGAERGGRYKMNLFGRARNQLLTVTVTPKNVLAVMGQPDNFNPQFNGQMNVQMGGFNQFNQGAPSTIKLVCLDRDTGRELWSKTPNDLPDSAAAIKTGDYNGTPLYVPAQKSSGQTAGDSADDSILIAAHGSNQNQFDDCYIVCLSAKTGQYRWSSYVGSATRTMDPSDGSVLEYPSMLSLANGRVFVMTNLGTVAALDPGTGQLLWLNSYNREGGDAEAVFRQRLRFGGGFANPDTSATATKRVWAQNPVIVSDGCVFALPCDSKVLTVYDGATGEVKKQLPMNLWDDAAVLLGAQNGGVCVTSEKGIYMIDWAKYTAGDQKFATRWSHTDVTQNEEKSDICGRGFMTQDAVFLSTKNRLIQLTTAKGRTLAFYPHHNKFNGDQGPGNMLITAHNVVVARQTSIDVYTDLDLVRQKYETAMATSPNDPQPRIRYAEALFSGGQTNDALARVDEAINLIGGLNSMRSGKDRDMIFMAMLDFARRADKNADADKKAEGIAQANQFYDRAAAAADSPLQNATYRLARANFNHQQKDYTGEVKLCQEVLSDDGMRGVALSDDTNAGTAAEVAIDTAISADKSVYVPVEDQASAALKTARDSQNPKQLLAVATVYPNSLAASNAREDAVHLFEAANQPDQAIAVLRRMYLATTKADAKAHILESIANDFLAMPDGIGPAIDRLCKASKIVPDQKIAQLHLPDGTVLANMTYAAAVDKLRQIQSDQETAKLPDFHLATATKRALSAFVPGPAPVISNITAIVHPLRDYNRTDQILTWSGTGLSIFASGATTPTYTIAEVNDLPLGAAYVHDHWLVWTPAKLFQISGEGKVTWTYSVDHLPTMLVSAGGEAIVDDNGEAVATDDGINNINVVNGNVRMIQVNGQLIRVQGGGNIVVRRGFGRVALPQPPVPVVVQPVVARNGEEQINAVIPGGPAGDRILISTTNGRVVSVEGRSGQPVWQTRMIDHAVDQVLANAHFTVQRIDDGTGSQLAVYDTGTGHLIGKRRFGPENTATQLVNVALSEEGTLVMTLFSQIKVKDLYDPWKTAPVELQAQVNRDAAPYVGLNQPDQLLVKNGRVACLYDAGKLARGWDLSKNTEPTNPEDTHATNPAVTIQMVGKRLFILTSNLVVQHNLDDPADYTVSYEASDFPHARALWIGKDYAIALYEPVDRGPAGSPVTHLVCFNRSNDKKTTRESDIADYVETEKSHAGITDWQPCEGGMYYLTKDGNLHVLRGSRS